MDTDIARIRRVGERLRGELSALLAGFPLEARRLAGMARWLDVDQSTCRRVLAGAEHRGDPIEVVTKVPGVQGILNFTKAVRQKQVDANLVSDAEAAIAAFSELIIDCGGSQSSLGRRIAASLADVPGDGAPGEKNLSKRSESDRKAAFESAVLITRMSMEVCIGIVLVRPSETHPGRIDIGVVGGKVGVKVLQGANTLITYFSYDALKAPVVPLVKSSDQRAASDPERSQPSFILDEFTTHPLPTTTTKLFNGGLLHTVDPNHTISGPIDVIEGRWISPFSSNPLTDSSIPVINNGRTADPPARHLISDVYVHNDLARASLASVGVYIMGVHGVLGDHEHPSNRWYLRMNHQPNLRVLGPGIGQAHCDAYSRHAELTRLLFDSVGADPSGYFGYRCEERYPLYGMDYEICLDFSRPAMD